MDEENVVPLAIGNPLSLSLLNIVLASALLGSVFPSSQTPCLYARLAI
jgi:hypothetical protein